MPNLLEVTNGLSVVTEATGTNAIVTATVAAPGLRLRHVIRGVIISASAVPAAAVAATIKTGTTTLVTLQLPANISSYPIMVKFPVGVMCNENELASVSVPALGAAIVCSAQIFTRTVTV